MYSTDNEGRSIICEFFRILKNFSMKNISIDNLNDIVNKYNNRVESSFRKENVLGFGKENIDNDYKIKNDNQVRISKQKYNIIVKI